LRDLLKMLTFSTVSYGWYVTIRCLPLQIPGQNPTVGLHLRERDLLTRPDLSPYSLTFQFNSDI
jgi:hypothetical protein